MNNRLSKIRKAYDLTVKQHREGTDPLCAVPPEFRESPAFKRFLKSSGKDVTNSNAPENTEFLSPRIGINFLDAGCCANLANYRLDKWPATYYGVDISSALIEAMRGFAIQEGITVGGLHTAELVSLPFKADFFDIASCIGVLEYVDFDYTGRALRELNRVLKKSGRLVLDIPNLEHPDVDTMFKLEDYLGRTNIPKTRTDVEKLLAPLFSITRVDDSRVMLKYFLETKK